MTDILQIDGWEVISTYVKDNERFTEARFMPPETACQKCGNIGNLYRHGAKEMTFRDTPMFGKVATIKATVQRYRCRECDETFIQGLDGIDPDRRMTTRCVEYIQERCMYDPFTRIAQEVGCVEGTVRNIAAERYQRYDDRFKPYLPEWLGIDETMIDGVQRCVLTDVKNRVPIDMLKDNLMPTVTQWFHQFRNTRTIQVMVMDMHFQYQKAVHAVFPGLPVVIDKFHLVRMANRAMEEVRISLAKDQDKSVSRDWMRRKGLLRMRHKNLDEKGRFNLQMWLDNEPDIAQAYRVKEAFYEIYDAPTKDDAGRLLDEWRASIPKTMYLKDKKKGIQPLLTSTKNWREEILAYFDFPITNGYTEALNGVAKVINRAGRGYTFEVLRAKLLSRNKLLQPASVVVPPADESFLSRATTDKHEMLMQALGNRCECCGGVFAGQVIQAHHITAEVTGDRPKVAYICANCHKRFHTEGISHGNQLST